MAFLSTRKGQLLQLRARQVFDRMVDSHAFQPTLCQSQDSSVHGMETIPRWGSSSPKSIIKAGSPGFRLKVRRLISFRCCISF